MLVYSGGGSATGTLYNSVFYRNTTTNQYLLRADTGATFTNSLFQENVAPHALFDWNGHGTISYSDFYNNTGDSITWGTDVMTSNPRFVDPEADDFTLDSVSPCINAGDPSSLYDDPDGTRNDMGAYGGPAGVW